MAIVSRLFSISPRVRKVAGRLEAAPSWRAQLLTLGTGHRQVIVDPRLQAVIIRRRRFWLFRNSRRIPFQAICAALYAYHDVSFRMPWFWAYDTLDLFSVGLRLRDGSELELFRFFGAGEYENVGPLPDWWYWPEYVLDEVGTQESESRAFAELLSRLIGVPLESRS